MPSPPERCGSQFKTCPYPSESVLRNERFGEAPSHLFPLPPGPAQPDRPPGGKLAPGPGSIPPSLPRCDGRQLAHSWAWPRQSGSSAPRGPPPPAGARTLPPRHPPPGSGRARRARPAEAAEPCPESPVSPSAHPAAGRTEGTPAALPRGSPFRPRQLQARRPRRSRPARRPR